MAASTKSSGKKKSGGGSSSSSRSTSSSGTNISGGRTAGGMLRSMVGGAAGAAATDTLLDLVERLGLVDVVLGRVKSRIEETDLDELLDEVTDYLRRNPEVLVVSLGAVTVATGLLVWLNNRREWDGSERRGSAGARVTSSPGRVKRSTPVVEVDDDDDDDDE